jgi:ABC-type multidrug transport system ATPase subunit
MIRVTNLTKKFGRFRAVDELHFTVERGEALALWGSNGAGKTTVIRCVLGLLRYSGAIEVAGMNLRKYGKRARAMIGYVPQELAFHDDLRLLETLHFFAKLRGLCGDRPAAVLAEVGLAEHGRKRIRELSGGMKQRMALALALLADPPLLILDELTSNLDTAAQGGFMDLLRAQKHRGKTILFTSHRLDEIEHLADRVVVLESSKRTLECEPDELAQALGLRCTLQVSLKGGPHRLDDAVGELVQRGFDAQRNGVCLFVQVPPNEKAAPIRALTEAAIHVHDFELTNGNGRACSGKGGRS